MVIVECRTKKLQFGGKLDWCLEKFERRPRAEIKLSVLLHTTPQLIASYVASFK